MAKDLTKPFSIEDFEKTIRAKIKDEFIKVLPDEVFSKMVRDTLARFTEPTERQRYAGGPTDSTPSEFDAIALEVYKEWVTERVKSVLTSPEWTEHWDGSGNQIASDAITKLLVDNTAAIVATLLSRAMQATINDVRSQL